MQITAEQLQKFAPRAIPQLDGLNEAIGFAKLVTPNRLCCFMGEIAHETLNFLYLKELWGPTAQQLRYERDFAAPWPTTPQQAQTPAYAKNRLAYSLGNTEKGDGAKYLGYGDMQTTGRSNIRACSRFIFGDDRLLQTPELLGTPRYAPLSAAWFWVTHDLNKWVDINDIDGLSDVINIGHKTKAIGDANGYADRNAKIELARTIWK